MKKLLLFLALTSPCLATSPRVGDVRPITEKEEFSDLAEQILKLGEIAKNEVKITYNISSEEELVIYSYFLFLGDFTEPLKTDWTPEFIYNFGIKSSLDYVKQEQIEGFDFPDVMTIQNVIPRDSRPRKRDNHHAGLPR